MFIRIFVSHLEQKLVDNLLSSESVFKILEKIPFYAILLSKLTKTAILTEIQALIVEWIIDQF